MTANKDIPFYNKELHHAGDVVKQWVNGQLITMVVPETDADGNVLESGSIGRLTVKKVKLMKPKFRPLPKSQQIKKKGRV